MGVEEEQADAGRDGRTHLVRPSSQARTGTGNKSSADHEQDWQPYPVDPYLLYVMTVHTYCILYTMHFK